MLVKVILIKTCYYLERFIIIRRLGRFGCLKESNLNAILKGEAL
ncbi:hypothetical protein HMPREF1421_01554 [Helicobacter pylori GAM265BSii]|uniref:Uncharacterized protein n=1 Tax=Helicobacter pylori GAM265BSii TaxID=1159049 RepID=M3R6K5_HELPX|nr:hypothetical protein HMPREF1399_01589 [Helicobacter pylori GAM118Bi]EMH27052.1 hypothetical protein HMPREF1421_01554 [Helicobacter pylori GAM265BSii]